MFKTMCLAFMFVLIFFVFASVVFPVFLILCNPFHMSHPGAGKNRRGGLGWGKCVFLRFFFFNDVPGVCVCERARDAGEV